MEQQDTIKIGIIGTGRIASRFLEESKYVSEVEVTAIYNRHIESTIWFAQQNHIDINGKMILTDDLAVLLESVDAVYIATPHETHAEYAKTALTNRKHVLCEKPLALKKTDAQEIFELAKKNNKICMEAISEKCMTWMPHSARLERQQAEKCGEHAAEALQSLEAMYFFRSSNCTEQKSWS